MAASAAHATGAPVGAATSAGIDRDSIGVIATQGLNKKIRCIGRPVHLIFLSREQISLAIGSKIAAGCSIKNLGACD
jgi:hypothetical protein